MSYKVIPQTTREKIIKEIKEHGKSANRVANEYGVSPKTVYGWLTKESKASGVSWLAFNRLKAENDQLKRIIGELALDNSRKSKKN